MKLLILAAMTAVALSGCQSKPINEMSYTELKQTADQIEKRCADQGITRSSPDFQACIRQEADREVAQRAHRRRAMVALGEGLQETGRSYSNAAAMNRPINCNTYTYGASTRTTCY